MTTTRAFEEIIDFITDAPKPEKIIAFRPSAATQAHLEMLLDKKRADGLSEVEQYELSQFLLIEHLMRMAKAKAKKRLKA